MKSLFLTFGIAFLFAFASVPALSAQTDEIAEGKKLLEEEKYDEAIKVFEGALKKEGKAFDARLGLARAYLGSGDVETANFHAVKAEKLNTKSAEACELTGLTFRKIGEQKAANQEDPSADFEQAVDSFGRALANDPKNVTYAVQMGQIHWNLGNFKAAGEDYEKAASIEPANTQHINFASQCYVQAGDTTRAFACVEKAIAEHPNVPMLRVVRAQAMIKANQKAEAADECVTALTTKCDTRDHILPGAQGIWNAFKDEKAWAEAVKRYEAWAAKMPQESEAFWWLGYCRMQAGDAEKAVEAYTAFDKLIGPESPEGLFRLGEALTAKGDYEKACESLVKASKKTFNWSNDASHNPMFKLEEIGGVLFNNNKLEQSVMVNEKYVLPNCPASRKPYILQNVGFLYREWGTNIQNGEGGKQKAMELWKKSRDAYEAAVAAMAGQDMPATSKAQIENDCGLMYHYHFEDLDGAMKHYKKALAYDPNFGDVILNVGRVYNRLGKYQDAIDILEKGPKDRVDIQMELRNAKRKLEKSN